MLETEDAQTFFEFWPVFRDKTRWYFDSTRTIIAVKREAMEWMSYYLEVNEEMGL